jgi:hypothetical protein
VVERSGKRREAAHFGALGRLVPHNFAPLPLSNVAKEKRREQKFIFSPFPPILSLTPSATKEHFAI